VPPPAGREPPRTRGASRVRWPPASGASGSAAALERARALATRIAKNAPLALAAVNEVLRATQGLDDRAAFARQDQLIAPLLSSDDAHEGAVAFAEKRAPVWRGR
jgi:enoyl-CoA hydratase